MYKVGSTRDVKKIHQEILGLIEGESNLIANLANIASWIFHAYGDLNWCGFYLWSEEDQELILGPFQGKPACIRIKKDRGVCGGAFSQDEVLNVPDVHAFPGHIACDSASESELVIPLRAHGKIWGVLDLDAPVRNRFTSQDADDFELMMNDLSKRIFKPL